MRALMPPRRRWTSVALALLSATAFAISVEAGVWWSAGEVVIGPFGARHCFGGDCRRTGLSWLGGGDLWMRSAVATGVAGLIAMLVLVAMAGGVAAGRVPRLFGRTALVALGCATIVGGYFVTGIPSLGGIHLALGPILFALGIALGAIAANLVVRYRAA